MPPSTTAAFQLPRDGPATIFQSDPHLSRLPPPWPAELKTTPLTTPIGNDFGLVLVTAWPPSPHLSDPYHGFIDRVRGCFPPEDVTPTTAIVSSSDSSSNNNDDDESQRTQLPPVYLYPFSCLHVTIATLLPFTTALNLNPDERHRLESHWRQVIHSASQRSSWPRGTSVKLRLRHAQIGSRAGILLWEDLMGVVGRIRQCLAEEISEREEERQQQNIPATWSLPSIIHSTFLRFRRTPLRSQGEDIQERFGRDVLPFLNEFPYVSVGSVVLVCERTPYMHIPRDERHVLEDFLVGESQRGEMEEEEGGL